MHTQSREVTIARYTPQTVKQALRDHLHDGETLKHHAYGVKQPHILVICALMCLAILPGVIAVALLTKEYIVGLTDRRLIVLRVSGGKAAVREVSEYALDRMPPAKTRTGPIFTHIMIRDPAQPFVAKFHRAGMADNRANAKAIGDTVAAARSA